MTRTGNTKIVRKLRAIYIALLVNVALLGAILGCLFALFIEAR